VKIQTPTRGSPGLRFQPGAVLAGLVVALAVGLALSLLTAIALLFTRVGVESLGPIGSILAVVAALCGGFYSGRRVEGLGWIHGALAGLLFGLTAVLTGLLQGDGFSLGPAATRLVIGLLAGAAGGIIGVNF